jgi:hypothetical protein
MSALWVIARAAKVDVVEQLVVMFMIRALVMVVLGPAMLRTAEFPLLLFVAAVPKVKKLVPGLNSIKAKLAKWFLRAADVPTLRHGRVITALSGPFQLAQSADYQLAARDHATALAEMRPVLETVKRALWDSFVPGRAGDASQ